MSYPRTSNGNTHLIPNGTGVLGVETLSATAAVHGEFLVTRRCAVKRIGFLVTTAVNSSADAEVEFNRRPTIGSVTGEVLIGTIKLPSDTAAGTLVWADVKPVIMQVGEALALEHTVQASGAGAGFYVYEVEDAPEVPGNEDNMILSE